MARASRAVYKPNMEHFFKYNETCKTWSNLLENGRPDEKEDTTVFLKEILGNILP